jgi:hypothetical protein
MDTNERLLVQAGITQAAQPNTRVWVYRNSAYGYPWYDSVRFILDDPTYAPWFIMFNTATPYSPKCDNNYTPPKCTEYFHTQMDTPLPGPGGYGRCAPPACNCGSKPCGFYVFSKLGAPPAQSAPLNGAQKLAPLLPTLTRRANPNQTDHSSDAVIHGQTFQQWFIQS